MRCPKCACQDDKVVDSRSIKDGAGVRRRRECSNCGFRFTTCEEIVPNELKVIKRDGSRENFDREKLRTGIEKACWKRAITQEQVDALVNKLVFSIENDYDREVPSVEIGARAIEALRDLDEVACISFASVDKDFQNLDEFLKEIRTMNRDKRKKPVPGAEQ